MAKQQLNIRISLSTREMLDFLTKRHGTQSEAVAVAIALLYTRELEQGNHEGDDQS